MNARAVVHLLVAVMVAMAVAGRVQPLQTLDGLVPRDQAGLRRRQWRRGQSVE